ncbi:MAG: hypothetical protein QOJ59_148, partial [Thermomicrobiales bacterium]|nr:hypothetical protein [Thermomicrobiales bacterium]
NWQGSERSDMGAQTGGAGADRY